MSLSPSLRHRLASPSCFVDRRWIDFAGYNNQLLLGDNLSVLPTFPDDSADLVLFSPPYWRHRRYNGIGNGNEATRDAYFAYLLALFQQCLRVVKTTGCVILNLGDRWVNGSQQLEPYQIAFAILDRFQVKLVNNVPWDKLNGLPKAHSGKRLANHTEQFFVFAKSDEYYFDPQPFRKEKPPRNYTPSSRLGKRYREKIKSSDLSENEKKIANQELDGLIQEVRDGEIEGFRLKIRGIHALPFRGMDSGGSRAMLNRGFHIIRLRGVGAAKNIVEHAVDSRKGGLHPAVFPKGLVQKFIDGFSPPGGTVVDPCMGSGTTAIAAMNMGRNYIGIEIDPAYHADSVTTVGAHRISLKPAPQSTEGATLTSPALSMPNINHPAVVYHGDSLELLTKIPENSIDAVVTDPPYHLITSREMSSNPQFVNAPHRRFQRGFMNSEWDGGDLSFRSENWAKVFRVLKPGADMACFAGGRTYHRLATAIENAGFDIRDPLMWLFGSGFPKSQNVRRFIDKHIAEVGWESIDWPRRWDGLGTALKPGHNPILLCRKPLSEPTVAANVVRWGTGALNIDACRVPTHDKLGGGGENAATSGKFKGGWRRPWMDNDNAKEAFAAKVRDNVGHAEANGRWPSTVIHDGSEEILDALGPTARYFSSYCETEDEAIQRFIYMAKASKADRRGSSHPCVKPVKLLEWLVKLVTPAGGTVLDPFSGTGTSGEAAMNSGFRALLIEKELEYYNDCLTRMRMWL